MQRLTLIPGLALGVLTAACDGAVVDAPTMASDSSAGTGHDAGPHDAGLRDAASASDGGNSSDASVPDAATTQDASAVDAAVVDASVVDATVGAGCAGKGYLVCEDFESTNVGSLPTGWTAVPGWNAGAAVVASDQHHGGSKSLKGALAANGQPRAARSLSGVAGAADKHWGRIFYKLATPISLPPSLDTPAQGVIHGTLVGLQGSTESRVVDTVLNQQGKHQFLYNLPDDSCCTSSAYDYSFDGAWHCAEWYVDAANQSFRFFYEGKEVSSLAFTYGADGRAMIGQFKAVVVGFINYQTARQPHFQAWFDDLVIDDERVGCE